MRNFFFPWIVLLINSLKGSDALQLTATIASSQEHYLLYISLPKRII